MRSIVCLGGASVDRKFHLEAGALPATSNPARATRGFGGVARNVAENLARLGIPVSLLSRVGADDDGAALLNHAAHAGIDTRPVASDAEANTSEYAAILDANGDLVIAAADARAVEGISVEHLERHRPHFKQAAWLFLDCNLSAEAIAWCIALAKETPLKIAVDAVSDAKVSRLPHDLHGVALLVLNRTEAAAYLGTRDDAIKALRERGAQAVVLTLGTEGLVAADESGTAHVAAVHTRCVDATGAGDALVAALLCGLVRGETLLAAAQTGVLAAALTVESPASVRPDLSLDLLAANHHRLEPPCTNP